MCFLLDALLPLSALIFWLPVNPQLSTLPVLIWLVIQFLIAPSERRWVAWPILFIVLLGAQIWWFNPLPAPASLADAVLFVCALLGAASVSPKRWPVLLKLLSGALVPMLFFVGSKPWNPNPFVGSNQAAYLMGFALIIAVLWLLDSSQSVLGRICAAFLALLGFVLIWQTGSRAALVASLLSILFVVARFLRSRYQSLRPVALLAAGLSLLYVVRWQFFSAGSQVPGLKAGSDLGRLSVLKCFSEVPFSGHNRLLYGAGFEDLQELCSVYFQGSPLAHSHNIYVQIWAASGLLGLLGLSALILLAIGMWREKSECMPLLVRRIGQASLVYALIQGAFDLSLVHWPVTLILSGIYLAIPLASWSSQESKVG